MTTLAVIPIEQLHESPLNPRKHYDPEGLKELAASLRETGQLEALLVRPMNGRTAGGYEIASGHRRFRAAKLAGLTQLEAKVQDLDDRALIEILNIANLQRHDLTPLDEAAGFKLLMEKAGYDVAKLAARIGLSVKYVYDRLKLLQLIPAGRKLLEDGTITAGHAILLARLGPTDQQRAIGSQTSSWRGLDGGLFETEEADGLPLKDRVKPRSVRELATWIHDNVRMTPEATDPFLFPETATVLAQAKEDQDKVVHITYDYRVPDGARDEKNKTYGAPSWKRADGRERSKKCDRSVIGHVVAGLHQGEAFRVCVNKHRCKVHWRTEALAYERREKTTKTTAAPKKQSSAAVAAEKAERESAAERRRAALEDELFPEIVKARTATFLTGVKRRAAQLAGVPEDALLAMEGGDFWPQAADRQSTEHDDEIEAVVQPELPGKWSKGYGVRPKDAKAARHWLGLKLYLVLDTAGLDEALDRELEAAIKAALKAEQAAAEKKAEKKPAKPKRKQ